MTKEKTNMMKVKDTVFFSFSFCFFQKSPSSNQFSFLLH